jgi:hypothetical protein
MLHCWASTTPADLPLPGPRLPPDRRARLWFDVGFAEGFDEANRAFQEEVMRIQLPLLLGILAAALASGCQSAVPGQSPSPKPDPKVVELFGGPDGYDVLINAARVDAFRVSDGMPPSEADQNSPGGYAEIAGPVAISEASLGELKSRFADANSYLWDMAKACIFQPGVRFDFIRGDDRLQILVCFSCDELQAWHNGKRVGGEDIDRIRPVLLQVAQQAFPEDADIQALKP